MHHIKPQPALCYICQHECQQASASDELSKRNQNQTANTSSAIYRASLIERHSEHLVTISCNRTIGNEAGTQGKTITRKDKQTNDSYIQSQYGSSRPKANDVHKPWHILAQRRCRLLQHPAATLQGHMSIDFENTRVRSTQPHIHTARNVHE